MGKTFKGSMLSGGGTMFPPQITIENGGVSVKVPGLFGGKSNFFPYSRIDNVSIDSPLVGFSTIRITAGNCDIEAKGFSKDDAEEIKNAILSGGNNEDYNLGCEDDDYQVSEKKKGVFAEMMEDSDRQKDDSDRKQEEEDERFRQATEEIINMKTDFFDEKSLVSALQKLASIIEANMDPSSAEDENNVIKLRETARGKFKTLLALLKTSFPESRFIGMMENKHSEWQEIENALKAKKKKEIIIALSCTGGFFVIIGVLLAIFG